MAAHDDRRGLAGRRIATALAAGVVVLVVCLVTGAGWTVGLNSAWGATALVMAGRIWLRIRRMNDEQTAAHATAEDYSRPTADLVALTAAVASLIAIAFTLVQARHHSGTVKGLLIALAVTVVALSWAMIHLVFTVRYGDVYYADPEGGIDFHEEGRPDYRDFVYFAFTVGMTFQVSDTDITTKNMRRQVTQHALLSFLFGAVIVALAINSVASLLQ